MRAIAIDGSDNKWITTPHYGLLVYKEGGVILNTKLKQELLMVDHFLKQNYPNPFNPSTTIAFDLPKMSEVTLKIFNILGEEVATLVSERLSAGSYSYECDASNLASGVYLYRLQTGSYVETRKMVLMR